MKPLAIDLFCGLGGWTEGLLSMGWDVIGFDIEHHRYDGVPDYPGQLVLQDVLTLQGAQFKDADLIVASPPCQEYSYMAMPFSRGKQIERALNGKDEFPRNYKGSRTVIDLNKLFHKAFYLREAASLEKGKHIPLIVENVSGAQKWVGRSRWNFGSYHLWGDVPALMPNTLPAVKVKSYGGRRTDKGKGARFTSRDCGLEKKQGGDWFSDPNSGPRQSSQDSPARARASALIAKIPRPLSEHIGRVFYPN